MKTYSNCQSCFMPLSKDPKGSGKNLDGKPSNKYCSFCYDDGVFLQPDISVEEMQNFVKNKLKEMGGFMRFFAGFFTRGIPKLERWRKS